MKNNRNLIDKLTIVIAFAALLVTLWMHCDNKKFYKDELRPYLSSIIAITDHNSRRVNMKLLMINKGKTPAFDISCIVHNFSTEVAFDSDTFENILPSYETTWDGIDLFPSDTLAVKFQIPISSRSDTLIVYVNAMFEDLWKTTHRYYAKWYFMVHEAKDSQKTIKVEKFKEWQK